MVTAAQKVELTNWFRPENYEALKDITLTEFYQEFRLRRAMYQELEEAIESDDPEWLVGQANQEALSLILTGKPLLTKALTAHIDHPYVGDQHVRLLSVGRFYMFDRHLKASGLLRYSEKGDLETRQDDKHALSKPLVSYVSKRAESMNKFHAFSEDHVKRKMRRAESILPLLIDIGTSTDEQIIESMRYFLTCWRKQTGIKVKVAEQPYGFGEVMVQKLIDFRIIPILDLLYHAKHNDYKLSDKDLERLLYRWGMEDIRDQIQIKETDRPLARKALTGEFDNLFTMFLYKNRHLMDMEVRDVIEMKKKSASKR